MRLELRRGRQRGKMARADEDTDDVSSVSAGSSGVGHGSQPPSPASVGRFTNATDDGSPGGDSPARATVGTAPHRGSGGPPRWVAPAPTSAAQQQQQQGQDGGRHHLSVLSTPDRGGGTHRLRRSQSSPSTNEPTRGASGVASFDNSLILSDDPPSPPRPDADADADGGVGPSQARESGGVLSTLAAVLYEIIAFWFGFVTSFLLPGERCTTRVHTTSFQSTRASAYLVFPVDVRLLINTPFPHILCFQLMCVS
jgi:hypothetical protein